MWSILYYLDFLLEERTSFDVKSTRIPILIPYEMMGAIYSGGEIQRQLSLFGAGGRPGVEAWWRKALKYTKWAQKHPKLMDRDELFKLVGYVVHADGAEVPK